ncbi:MAG: hypothetical protein IJX77_05300 [Ruminococcus sp.]|nr:hypothetical protein [Ruminococcus sp.]
MSLDQENNSSEAEKNIQKSSDKASKVPIIILSAVLALVVIALIIFMTLYFSDKQSQPAASDESIAEEASDEFTESFAAATSAVVITAAEETTATTTVTAVTAAQPETTVFEPYIIKLKNAKVYIYDAPAYSAAIVGEITDMGSYTIVEEYTENGASSDTGTWGRLKSGAGWINLSDASNEAASDDNAASAENDISQQNEDTGAEAAVPESTAEAEDKPDVISETINGVTFNYVPSFYYMAEYTGDVIDYDLDFSIKYCEPSEYMSADSRITGIMSTSGMYDKSEIGNLYFSAGTDDFAVFEVTVKGDYTDEFFGSDYIEFRKYTADGLLLSAVGTNKTDYEMYAVSDTEGTIDQTVYIGFYTSEVARVDFRVFGVGANGIGEW